MYQIVRCSPLFVQDPWREFVLIGLISAQTTQKLKRLKSSWVVHLKFDETQRWKNKTEDLVFGAHPELVICRTFLLWRCLIRCRGCWFYSHHVINDLCRRSSLKDFSFLVDDHSKHCMWLSKCWINGGNWNELGINLGLCSFLQHLAAVTWRDRKNTAKIAQVERVCFVLQSSSRSFVQHVLSYLPKSKLFNFWFS